MARTRAHGKKPQGVQKSVNTRRAHPQQRVSLKLSVLHQQLSRPTKFTPLPDSRPSDKRTKRGIGLDHDSEPPQKRPRRSFRLNPPTPTKRGAKRNVKTPDCDTPRSSRSDRLSNLPPPVSPTAQLIQSKIFLYIYGDQSLNILVESTEEGWNNSMPLTGTRPQPDFSIGFRRESFTEDQLLRLSSFIGDFIAGDVSYFMATYSMYFPFLTCEVKCGATGLDVADRQNAHSMTLAVRAVVELFRAVKREKEVHQQILGFSVSHDHRSVRIYGHYPVIDEKTANTRYYHHLIP
ncbi:unnamed protein product [Clonostachys rosea f. rosea IK726]|uniref:Uncharacterized protein n=1 Tax=Clonostachys rosea f. rosea IK726 TaxID=1349383 RepID=A0ACA9TZ07_BIOOC|nr:unnamed protein product [Clonostachys rosea f. rosea IK726]